MDAGARIFGIMKAARADNRRGTLPDADLAHLGERANRLSARIRLLKGLPPRQSRRERAALAMLDRLARAIRKDGTVVALDVGYDRHNAFDEVGISAWRAGVVETVTLVRDDALHRHPDAAERILRHPGQVFRPSLFGPTLRLPAEAVLLTAREALESADVAVFQSASIDLRRLGLSLDPARIVDTAMCGQAWHHGRTPSLADLCARYGFDVAEAHNSGNDARRTLDVALAMLSDPMHGRLVEQERLRTARDEAHRRMVMLPTRRPGFEKLRAVWAEARLADERHAVETVSLLAAQGVRTPRNVARKRNLYVTRAALVARGGRRATTKLTTGDPE